MIVVFSPSIFGNVMHCGVRDMTAYKSYGSSLVGKCQTWLQFLAEICSWFKKDLSTGLSKRGVRATKMHWANEIDC